MLYQMLSDFSPRLFPNFLLASWVSIQIADAVVVARYLGATLVLPDIRGSKPGDQRLVVNTTG